MSADPFAGLELLATAVVVLDEALVVRYTNPAAQSLFGAGAKGLLGGRFAAHFAEGTELEAMLREALGAHWDWRAREIHQLRPERAPVPLSCVVTRVELPGCALLVELRPIEEQMRLASEERARDQRAAARELIRNLAHEIRNPLGGLRGSAQLLERELERPELREYTRVIIKEADRLQALLDRLLVPQRTSRLAPVNIHEVLDRVRSLVLAEFPDSVRIVRDYDPSLPELPGDFEQLVQAVLNLARNAAQALVSSGNAVRGGTVVLRTRVARQVTIQRRLHRLALELQVVDDGPGIPEEIRDRLFTPLVSAREGGSGLGLSLVLAYVHNHGGAIGFESRPGRTVFRMLLPLP